MPWRSRFGRATARGRREDGALELEPRSRPSARSAALGPVWSGAAPVGLSAHLGAAQTPSISIRALALVVGRDLLPFRAVIMVVIHIRVRRVA